MLVRGTVQEVLVQGTVQEVLVRGTVQEVDILQEEADTALAEEGTAQVGDIVPVEGIAQEADIVPGVGTALEVDIQPEEADIDLGDTPAEEGKDNQGADSSF